MYHSRKTRKFTPHTTETTPMSNKRYISILSDFGFKKTFGNTSNTLFLRTAIQALIQSKVRIAAVEFDRNEIGGLTKENRGGLFDVSCIDENGDNYIIEMQLDELKKFIKRSTFYASNRYGAISKKGDFLFDDLKKIYMISLLNGVIYPDSSELHHIGQLRNQHGELLGDEITQVIFEIGKWNKPVEEIKSNLDKLIYVMKVTHTLKTTDTFTPPEFWSEEWIQSTLKELDFSKMTPMEREYAERQIVKAVQYANSQKEKEEAIREKEKLQQQLTTATINLLNINMSPQEIADILNISLEEVLKIKQTL